MNKPTLPHDALDDTQFGARMPTAGARAESMRRTRKAFENLGRVSNKMAPAKPFFDRFFDRLLPSLPASQELEWGDEADWARLQQEPLRARRLLRLIVFVVLLMLVWASFAELDEVTRGEGKVIPSRQVQIVQAVDAGMVEKILVREGQEVKAGDVLLQIDPTRFTIEVSVAQAEILGLKARQARLQALTSGQPFVMPEEVLKGVPDIATHELGLYHSSHSELESLLSSAREQLTQREQELKEAQAFYDQASRGLMLAEEELQMYKALLDKNDGSVSRSDVLAREQAVSKFVGDRDQAAAKISRVKAAMVESKNNIQEVEFTKRNLWSKELSETMTRLGSVSAGVGVSADKVKQAEVRSPVRGTIKRLLVNTVNGFVQQGKELVEIVPLDDELLLEAQVKPKDIAFLRPGLPARVKITAYDFSIFGGMDAVVEQISADTVVDEKGNAFYLIKVRTHKSSLGENMPITPGMVAEVDVLTGKKTVLSYLLKPVLRAKANAMTER